MAGMPVLLKAHGCTLSVGTSPYAPLICGTGRDRQGLLTLQGGTLDCSKHTLELSGPVCMEGVKVLCTRGEAAVKVGVRGRLDLQCCAVEASGGGATSGVSSRGSSSISGSSSRGPSTSDSGQADVGTKPIAEMRKEIMVGPGGKLSAHSTSFRGLARGLLVYGASEASFEECTFDFSGRMGPHSICIQASPSVSMCPCSAGGSSAMMVCADGWECADRADLCTERKTHSRNAQVALFCDLSWTTGDGARCKGPAHTVLHTGEPRGLRRHGA